MKATFVCFPCKKVIKKVFEGGLDAVVYGDLLFFDGGATASPYSDVGGLTNPKSAWAQKCPKCQKATFCVGPAFETPKQSDDQEWKRQRVLAEAGYTASPCECFKEGNRVALAKLGVDSDGELKS